MTNRAALVALAAVVLIGTAAKGSAAQSAASVVEIESPLASTHPLQGYLRQPGGAGPSPAVVLLHSCNGDWGRLDERWGKRIAAWGYVTLTVDSFGPRGLKKCESNTADDVVLDAFRALNFLVRASFVDPDRIAVLGFAHGGRVALLSVERGSIEGTSANKFRAAIAFYPSCASFNGNVTVPTLILIGERDDFNSADTCRDMAAGRDGWGVSRQRGDGPPIKLIVYPGVYHAFDAPAHDTLYDVSGHHREFNQAATDQAAAALREFLDVTIGPQEKPQ